MIGICSKAIGLWFVLVVVAVINGVIRENLLQPAFGMNVALPVSGLLLSLLIFGAAIILIPVIGKTDKFAYAATGAIWVFMTLAFEFLFGHYGLGKSWREIFAVFNVLKGDLFILVLMTSAAAPWLAAKIRRYV